LSQHVFSVLPIGWAFDRMMRVGCGGRLIGEVISETYETELETLAAWMRACGG
jgi:hypothetical protein